MTVKESDTDVIVVSWSRLQVRATIQPKSDPMPNGLLVKSYPVMEFHPRIFDSEEFAGVLGEQPRQAVIDALVKANRMPFLDRNDPWLADWCDKNAWLFEMKCDDIDMLLETYARIAGFRFDPWPMLARHHRLNPEREF